MTFIILLSVVKVSPESVSLSLLLSVPKVRIKDFYRNCVIAVHNVTKMN